MLDSHQSMLIPLKNFQMLQIVSDKIRQFEAKTSIKTRQHELDSVFMIFIYI